MVSSYEIEVREWNGVMIQLSVEQIGGWFAAAQSFDALGGLRNAVTEPEPDGRAPASAN